MMRIVSLTVALSLLTSSCSHYAPRGPAGEGRIPEGRGVQTKFEGVIGGSLRCEYPTVEELALVDQKITHLKIDGRAKDVGAFGRTVVQDYIEELFFQEMAVRSHASTTCQLNFLKSYFSDQSIAHILNDNGWSAFGPYHSVLNEMMSLRNEKASIRDGLRMGHDPMDKSIYEAERMKKAALLSEEVGTLDQMMNMIIGQIPLGSHKVVQTSLRKLIASPTVSEADFISAYSQALSLLKPKLQEAEDYFTEGKDKDGFYKITRGDKIAFMQSGRAEHLLKEIDPQGNKLYCRLQAQYSKGPATTQLAVILGLVVASAFTDGAAAVLVGFGITASIVTDIQHQCFKPTMNLSSEEKLTCDPLDMASSSISEASMISCGVTIALAAAPVLGRFVRQVNAAQKLVRASRAARAEAAAAAREAKVAREVVEDAEIVVTARRTYKINEPVLPPPKPTSSPQYTKVSAEVAPCLEKLPANIQQRLKLKFKNQPEEKTIKDLQDIRDLRRINGKCK